MIGKLRPQIFLAIIVLGILSAIGLFYGMNEIATGCTGGIIAPIEGLMCGCGGNCSCGNGMQDDGIG